MIRAVEKVRARLDRATAALKAAGIPYAVAGGNAVAAWVSRVDEAAVRNILDDAAATQEILGRPVLVVGLRSGLSVPESYPLGVIHQTFELS